MIPKGSNMNRFTKPIKNDPIGVVYYLQPSTINKIAIYIIEV